jgi:hypothetical protein
MTWPLTTVEADAEHVIDRAVAVVAVDEEPEHAAFLEVTVAERHRQVLAVEGEVDHGRILAAAGTVGPHRAIADGRVLVRERREEFLRVEARSEVLADRERISRCGHACREEHEGQQP